jgi:hypothetical protein
MIEVYKPPTNGASNYESYSIFLAGSIEMGKAEDWQTLFTEYLKSVSVERDVDIYNHRRDDWDASWEQVTWELDEIGRADLVVFNFVADTVSPITLLELGLCADNNKNIVVHCPKDYFRYGNVAVVCDRYNVPMVKSFNELCETVLTLITSSVNV